MKLRFEFINPYESTDFAWSLHPHNYLKEDLNSQPYDYIFEETLNPILVRDDTYIGLCETDSLRLIEDLICRDKCPELLTEWPDTKSHYLFCQARDRLKIIFDLIDEDIKTFELKLYSRFSKTVKPEDWNCLFKEYDHDNQLKYTFVNHLFRLSSTFAIVKRRYRVLNRLEVLRQVEDEFGLG